MQFRVILGEVDQYFQKSVMKSIEGTRKRRAPPSEINTKLSKDSHNPDKPLKLKHRDERLREILNNLPPEVNYKDKSQ